MKHSSDPRITTNSVMLAAIAAGRVLGFSQMHKYGRLPETAKDVWEDVWALENEYTFQPASVRLGISSTNTVDANGAVGAWTVEIEGLDGNYVEQTETVILTGQTKVETNSFFLRVNRAKVRLSGSEETNAGRVYVYDTADDVEDGVPQTMSKFLAVIEAGAGQTQQAIYTIPAIYKGFLMSRHVSFSSRANQYVDVAIEVRPFGLSWLAKSLDPLASTGSPAVDRPYLIPMEDDLEGRTDIRAKSMSSAIELDVVVEFDLLLVEYAILDSRG